MWVSACRGFSVTEVTTTLTVVAALSGAVAPSFDTYIEEAKLVRAQHDVTTLAVSLVRLFNDVGPERGIAHGWTTYDLLIGAGAVADAEGPGTREWLAPAGDASVGLLDDQLIRNTANYTSPRQQRFFGWRGAYLQKSVGPDPWGHRYAVNVQAMREHNFDTFVLSAGADGIVEAPFQSDGLPPAGDDIVALISSTGVGR
jgi:type II secretion system (T2SS) protein G